MTSSQAEDDIGFDGHGWMEAHVPGRQPLEAALSDWLTSSSASGNSSGRMPADAQVPFPIRLTLNQLLELAEETELRAQTFAWMNHSPRLGDRSPSKVRGLHYVATELRRTAERLRRELEIEATEPSSGDVRLTSERHTAG